MENASKALIIAGAILLAIVIISLGLVVVNNSRNVTDNANLSEQEIQSFNAKFTSYEGVNISGSRVNSLIQQVLSTNQSSITSGDNKFVAIMFPTVSRISDNDGNYMSIAVKDNTLVYLNNQTAKYPNNGTGGAANSKLFTEDDYIKNSVTVSDDKKSTSYSLTVNTGKNYKVQFKYTNGLVSRIAVDPV